jgi:hypothetical protein
MFMHPKAADSIFWLSFIYPDHQQCISADKASEFRGYFALGSTRY